MAVGVILTPLETFPVPGLTSTWTGLRDRPVLEYGLWFPDPQQSGPLERHQPIDIRSMPFVGEKMLTFFDDYYNRIHIIPHTLNFGAIGSDQSGLVNLWNAYLAPSTLATITQNGLDGVTFDGPATPKVFGALQMIGYTVHVAMLGSPSVDVGFTFDFGLPGVVNLAVLGVRARIGNMIPNWRNSYRIVYEYKSDVLVSSSGKEQRRAIRATPRKTLEYLTTPKFASLRHFNRLMTTWQNKTFIVPEVPRQAVLPNGMALDSPIVTLASVPDWIVPDALLIISYDGVYDLRTVLSIDSLEVTFTSSGAAWPIGTVLHPSLSGLFNVEMVAANQTNGVSEVTLTFNVAPASETFIAPGEPEQVFNGREVFLKRANWASPPSTAYRFPIEQVDYGRGVTTNFRPIEFSGRVVQAAFLGHDYDQAYEMLQFFERMKGQRGEFYRPTGENDFVLVEATGGSPHLRVEGRETHEAYADDTVFRAIAVMLTDGTWLLRTVQSMTVVDDIDTNIEMTEVWPFALTADNVVMISWMPVWRLSSDMLTIEWLTNSVAQLQLTMQTLEDLTAEAG